MPIKVEQYPTELPMDTPLSLKEELKTWQDGITHFDAGDYSSALGAFELIADSSKIHFNIGMILQRLQRYEDAVISFAESTDCDGYLAVAYFQRGVCYYIMGAFESALEDFNESLAYLRGNTMIDYAQLGLDYKLYSCEALYNRALCHYQLGNVEESTADLAEASKSKQLPEHDQIDYAMHNECQDCRPFQVPEHLIYRPAKSKVDNSKKKDYLGSSKVVAAVNEGDSYTGFSGAKLRRGAKEDDDSDEPKQYVSQTLSRGLMGGTPTIGRNVGVQRSGTLSRPAMGIAAYATAPRAGGLQRSGTIGAIPTRRPSGPMRGVGGMALTDSPAMASGYEPSVDGQSVMTTMTRTDGSIKVKCRYGTTTRLILLPPDATFENLTLRLQEKFNLNDSALTIKYKDDDGEVITMNDDEDWACALDQPKVEIWVEEQESEQKEE